MSAEAATVNTAAMTDAELDVKYLDVLQQLHRLDIIPFDAETRRHYHFERGKCEDILFDLKMEMFRRSRYKTYDGPRSPMPPSLS